MLNLRFLRKVHQKIAPVIFLPLLVTVITGVIFDITETWFNPSESWKELILSIHKGAYLGEKIGILYVILNGLGVVVMLVTGLSMLRSFNRRQHPSE